jgi:hypothetical protein
MVRLFGRSSGRNRQPSGSNDISNNHNNKLRLSPTAALDTTITTPRNSNKSLRGDQNRHAVQKLSLSSPMYEYALDEYAQAVAPGTSNDDGRFALPSDHSLSNTTSIASPSNTGPILQARPKLHGARSTVGPSSPATAGGVRGTGNFVEPSQNVAESGTGIEHHYQNEISSQEQQQSHPHFSLASRTSSSVSEAAYTLNTNATDQKSQLHVDEPTGAMKNDINNDSTNNIRSTFERDRPDATYEEVYGPAYIGGTIKYLYPTGYQSMRPRSCPWKLSIVVCLLFTWLSVFIVGHCSDQADESAAAAEGSSIDDDALVMEIRWCGSRLLYMMWATSMMVTGLSAAYCSVIGYIKVRDFAVANSRSQPPGIADGKSDYYVRIRDHQFTDDMYPGASTIIRRNSSGTDGGSSVAYYLPTIYQSDGTPQFWGSHIYRPTQAAVAVTSR